MGWQYLTNAWNEIEKIVKLFLCRQLGIKILTSYHVTSLQISTSYVNHVQGYYKCQENP